MQLDHRTRITVFGGTGFIGRHLVGQLARTGAVIRIATRVPSRARALRPAGVVGQIVPVHVNLRDVESLAAAIAGADIVINCIGILQESRKMRFDFIHGEAPGIIAKAAKQAGVKRLIHISAIGASAQSGSRYAQSKAKGEVLVQTQSSGATILRPSVVFGADDAFLNRFARLARLSPVLPLIGGGATLFQPVYVGDVADAVECALRDESSRGQLYELGGPLRYSFRDLMEMICREMGRKPLLLPLPFPLARFQALLFELFLPCPPLTRDQVELLKSDNIITGGALTLATLGLRPTALEAHLPRLMRPYRKGGWFGRNQSSVGPD